MLVGGSRVPARRAQAIGDKWARSLISRSPGDVVRRTLPGGTPGSSRPMVGRFGFEQPADRRRYRP